MLLIHAQTVWPLYTSVWLISTTSATFFSSNYIANTKIVPAYCLTLFPHTVNYQELGDGKAWKWGYLLSTDCACGAILMISRLGMSVRSYDVPDCNSIHVLQVLYNIFWSCPCFQAIQLNIACTMGRAWKQGDVLMHVWEKIHYWNCEYHSSQHLGQY